MRTSCRFAMAVHVLAVLAYKKGEPVTSNFLAQSVNTNPVIIRRLLLALQKKKLVETRKGAGYGSSLKGLPAEIRLSDIYGAVEEEEPFALPRRKPNQKCPVGQCIQKALAQVFTSAEAALERELARTTLADILGMVKGCVEE
jgi:Rrf2 family protein